MKHKMSFYQKGILNVYAPNNKVTKYIRQSDRTTERNRQFSVIFGKFNTLFSVIDTANRLKITCVETGTTILINFIKQTL